MFNGTYALAASATSTFIVTFQQATLVYNDHVGTIRPLLSRWQVNPLVKVTA
ncbi:hypothetical protein MKY98_11950 [Paenibacillus sp. FSL M8-0228]|uniref:hypothetical protein n=1 Tax=Paenibacillus TaxID=44249 RepID=UPI001B5CE8EA|nr:MULTISPECIES: hypothetical protein [Paenibacillus]MBP1312161.1 hypothetical protein [Paenibacillus sp. 1182]